MSDGDKCHDVKWSREGERGPVVLNKAMRKTSYGGDILAKPGKTCMREDR